MARVTGPLMSMDASGTVAGAIVFSRWKGLPYVRRHAIPQNPRSPKQVSVRAMMTFVSRTWGVLMSSHWADWEAAAETQHMSGFNYFVGKSMSRWRTFRGPQMALPNQPVAPLSDPGVVTVTGGVREATLSIAYGAVPPNWAWLVFAALGAPVVPSFSNLVGCFANVSDPDVFVHTPIAPGVWHYATFGMNSDGQFSVASADAFDTVT